MKGARVYLILERLEGLGGLLHTEPSTEDLEDGNFDTDFQFIFISQVSQEEIEENILGNSEIISVVIKPFDKDADQKQNQAATINNETNEQTDKQENVSEVKVKTKPSETQKATTNTTHHNNNHKNQSIRVDLSRLDLFLNLVSELVVYRNQLEDISNRAHLTEIRRIHSNKFRA